MNAAPGHKEEAPSTQHPMSPLTIVQSQTVQQSKNSRRSKIRRRRRRLKMVIVLIRYRMMEMKKTVVWITLKRWETNKLTTADWPLTFLNCAIKWGSLDLRNPRISFARVRGQVAGAVMWMSLCEPPHHMVAKGLDPGLKSHLDSKKQTS